jgi:predicted nucleic acid-binding protein
VVIKWFRHEHEDGGEQEAAQALRRDFQSGALTVFAPGLLHLEIVNVAARRWNWPEDRLPVLARSLSQLGFTLVDPDLEVVARWTGAGLTSYDAAYVAVAEALGLRLVTADQLILTRAPAVARALA